MNRWRCFNWANYHVKHTTNGQSITFLFTYKNLYYLLGNAQKACSRYWTVDLRQLRAFHCILRDAFGFLGCVTPKKEQYPENISQNFDIYFWWISFWYNDLFIEICKFAVMIWHTILIRTLVLVVIYRNTKCLLGRTKTDWEVTQL